jgi:hypothetical protein
MGSTVTSNQITTVRAADLAERIVQEISEADQDWHAIELRAQELVEVLGRLAADPGGAPIAARRQ